MTCVIKMYKIVLLIAAVCLIFGELNEYSNVYNGLYIFSIIFENLSLSSQSSKRRFIRFHVIL